MSRWPDANVVRLRDLWSGILSATEIAALFTSEGFPMTRSAVLGKVHRLRLGLRDMSKAEGSERKPDDTWRTRKRVSKKTKPKNPTFGTRGKFQSPKPLPATPIKEPPPPPVARMVSLLDLKHGDCKFPLGDPRNPDFGFCGAKRHAGLPYCEYHAGLAYRTAGPPRSAEAKEKTRRTMLLKRREAA